MKNKESMNWIIHYIINAIGPGGIINTHTQGMKAYGHLDFQVVLNLPPEHIGYLLNTLGHRVQHGEHFVPGQLVSGLYEDCPIRLEKFRETGRDVLRVIIPDKNNRFPEDNLCDERYKSQHNRAFED